jgi:hypothetical protein
MQWKTFVDTAESGDQVILENSDRLLGGVSVMDAWLYKLEVDIGVGYELF